MKDLSATSRPGPRGVHGDALDALVRGAAGYRVLRAASVDLVRETPLAGAEPFSERHIQCLWFDPALRPATIYSTSGERIVVEHPGRWNLERGPDFLDAVIQVGPDKRRRQGDVEIHIRPSDWVRHGHRDDPHYRRVMLHVSFFDGKIPAASLPAGTLHIALKDAVAALPGFAFDAIDLTAYPYAVLQNEPPPCATALNELPATRREALLDAAGTERIRIKAARMRGAIRESGADQCLFEEVMGALGYKQNQRAFRLLARRLPLAALHEEAGHTPERIYAMLLGVADLLPRESAGHDAETRRFVRELWDQWWKRQTTWQNLVLPRETWQTFGQRPHNHPVRRLAAAAALFAAPGPWTARIEALDRTRPATWYRDARALIQDTARMDYWNDRLVFSGKRTPSRTALIGRGRTAAIISNIWIPFLAARNRDVVPLLDRLSAEQDNALIRQTAFSLFGRDHNPALYQNGLRQQGLLQIFHDFCINTRVGCPDCPLVAALRNDR